MILPFESNETWYTFWGGDSKELNQHHENKSQKYAYDFLIFDFLNKSYKNKGDANEDYYCFGKKIISPGDGEVVQVVNGVKDNQPGYLNGYFVPGNCIVIEISDELYCVLAHFKLDSIRVQVDQEVDVGEELGRVGNSGNSSEPHIHCHFQDKPNILFAKGVDIKFSNLEISRGGRAFERKENHSPTKGDFVRVLD